MRRLLNTLYLINPDSYIVKDGDNIVVLIKNEEKARIPAYNIESIISFGYMGASPPLIQMCAERNIYLSFLSQSGRFLGGVYGETKGNVLLRREQFRLADEEDFSLHISSVIIAGKICNMRSVVERFRRERDKEDTGLLLLSTQLMRLQKDALCAGNMDELRGMEGNAARLYFSVFDRMILNDNPCFKFGERSRRPPKNIVNALLSFAYVLIAHDVAAALETVGLDPYVGFMHTDRPGRQSLALDMMEEFRAYAGDRFVLSLINKRLVSEHDFILHGDAGVMMTDNGKRTFLDAWQKRKKEELIHPFLKEKIPIGLLPYAQAMLLCRFIRGELNNYPVFILK